MNRSIRAGVCGAALLVAACAGCKDRPADLRPWQASDHSRDDAEGPGEDPAAFATDDVDPIAVATAIFRAQCTSCHGDRGHGDGPQAAMFHPPDWSTPAFQATFTDEQLREAITHGRNSMPPFGATIRPEGIALLVRLVRQYGGAPVPTAPIVPSP